MFISGLTEGVRIGFDSIRANIFRSGLTILGVGIGVGVVVLMSALITGIRGTVQEGIENAGPRNFFVTRFDLSDISLTPTRGRPPWWNRPPVTLDEARRINDLPAVQSAVLSLSMGGMAIEFEGTRVNGIGGAAESWEWPDYRAVTFVQGRNFVPSEVDGAASVIILSERLATDLFGSRDPIGLRVRSFLGTSGAVPLTVVGVIATGESLFEQQSAYLAILPYSTALRRLGAQETQAQIIVVPQADVPIEEAEDQVIGAMRGIRGLAPGEENSFSILRSTQLLEFFDQFTAVFFMVMLALSSVGLLVGGVGVIGIMLISVTERTREIGVRKALGATPAEILWQFLVEAGVLTLMGGAAGLLFGGGMARIVANLTPIPATVPLWAVVASLIMAAITGMLFGLAPAARAARLDPVVALRHE